MYYKIVVSLVALTVFAKKLFYKIVINLTCGNLPNVEI